MDETTRTLWVDPIHHDPLTDGPPYLPGHLGGKVARMVNASDRALARQVLKQAEAMIGMDVAVAFQHCLSEYGGAPSSEMAVLLACIRAEVMIHQTHHWQARGQTQYGDHLLFERVYDTVNGFVDKIAEKAVSTGHLVNVEPRLQMSQMSAFIKIFYSDAPVSPGPEEMVLLSLRTLSKSALVLVYAYKSLEAKGQLLLGTDNLLQGVADEQEGLVYLLKQRSMVRMASVPPNGAAWKR